MWAGTKLFTDVAYFLILGKPVIFYLGIITILMMFVTATLGLLVIHGKVKFVFHKWCAWTTITLAIVHGLLALAVYL